MRVLLRLLHQSNIPGRNRVILVTILFQFYLQNHLQTTSDGSIIEIEKKRKHHGQHDQTKNQRNANSKRRKCFNSRVGGSRRRKHLHKHQGQHFDG